MSNIKLYDSAITVHFVIPNAPDAEGQISITENSRGITGCGDGGCCSCGGDGGCCPAVEVE